MRFLLDVNVLIALGLDHHLHHARATRWFETSPDWATTAMTESAYLRLLINRRVVGYEISPGDALAALRTLRGLSDHAYLADDTSLAEPMINVSWLAGAGQVTDFHLLNTAARHGVTLATLDGSFVRSVDPADHRHLFLLPE